MKTLMLKVGSGGHVSLGHPLACPGPIRDSGANIRIAEIPDEVPATEVARLYRDTADVTWAGGRQRHEFRFSELGVGRIIRV